MEGLNLSLMTVFYVMITLILIHLAVRIWREVLTGRLLTDSGMDAGLIHSITLISSYILWGLGILTGLSILGVNGQSIAVVFVITSYSIHYTKLYESVRCTNN